MAVTRLVALGPSLAVCIATGSDTGLFNAINEWLNITEASTAEYFELCIELLVRLGILRNSAQFGALLRNIADVPFPPHRRASSASAT